MSNHVKTVAAAVASSLALAATTDARAQGQESDWKFEVTPYFWGVGTDADIKVAGRKFNIDEDPSDFFDRVDSAGSLLGGFQYKRWVTFAQVDFLHTDTDELDNSPASARFEADTLFATLASGYQLNGWAEGQTFDIMLGARYMRREPKLTLRGVGTFKGDRDIVDPLLVVRPSLPLSERWRFNPTLSVGGGDDSDLTYELQPQFQFQFTDHLAGRIGYRKLFYDVESDNGRNSFDGNFEGIIIGLGGNFGNEPYRMAKKEVEPPAPVAVAAVTPPSAPPAAIDMTDTDGDQVPDFRDKCPSTPAGREVDPVGCAYNTKLEVQFETDSAQLKPESYPELDRAVEALKATPTFNAVVEGYTDSTGSTDHNRELSKRRAKAVAGYLIEKGVSPDRLETQGFGEAKPAAPNDTEEGRAENRRVILRRFDSKG